MDTSDITTVISAIAALASAIFAGIALITSYKKSTKADLAAENANKIALETKEINNRLLRASSVVLRLEHIKDDEYFLENKGKFEAKNIYLSYLSENKDYQKGDFPFVYHMEKIGSLKVGERIKVDLSQRIYLSNPKTLEVRYYNDYEQKECVTQLDRYKESF